MVSFPTLNLKAALTTLPLAASPDYRSLLSADGNTRLISGTITRRVGQAGTATFVLDNSDGELNPWNRTSGYYGNLLTANQADVETDTTGFVVRSNCTIARGTAHVSHGVGSLEVTAASAGSAQAGTLTGTGGVPVTAGKQYSAVISLLAQTGHTPNVAVIIDWWRADGSFISFNQGAFVTTNQFGFQQGFVTANAPAGAAFASISGFAQLLANSEIVYFDQLGIFGGSGFPWSMPRTNGRLQPDVKTQLDVTYAGTTHQVFTAHADDWGGEWENIKYGDSTLKCTDAFKYLTLTKKPRTDYRDLELSLTADAIYGMDESSTSLASSGVITAVDSSGNGRDGSYDGEAPGFGVNGALPAEVGTAVRFTRQETILAGSYVQLPITVCPSGHANFSAGGWLRPYSFNQNSPVDQVWHIADVGSQSFYFIINSMGQPSFTAFDGTNGGTLPSTTSLTLGYWNHVYFVKNGTAGPTNWRIYLNGVDISDHAGQTLQGTGDCNLTANASYIAGYEAGAAPPTGTGGAVRGRFDGDIDEWAIWKTTALTPTNVGDLYADGFGLVAPALSGTRIGQFLDLVGVPGGDRNIDAGQFVMQPVDEPIHDTPPLALIATGEGSMVESEGWPAAFFIAADGAHTFEDRSNSVGGVLATFSDSTAYYFDPGPGPSRNDANLWTTVVLQAANGKPQTATDDTTEYTARTLTRTGLRNADDADVATMATALLARYSQARDRIATLVLHPVDEPTTMFPLVLGLELNDPIAITRTDLPGSGTPFDQWFRIVGITHSFTAQDWHTTYELDPV